MRVTYGGINFSTKIKIETEKKNEEAKNAVRDTRNSPFESRHLFKDICSWFVTVQKHSMQSDLKASPPRKRPARPFLPITSALSTKDHAFEKPKGFPKNHDSMHDPNFRTGEVPTIFPHTHTHPSLSHLGSPP